MRRKVMLIVGLTAALAAAGVVSTVASASSRAPHQRSNPKRKPHRQALSGSLRRTPTKVVKVVLLGGKGGGIDPGDDYPAQWRNRPKDSVLDQWREYNRECTSFVAWALYSRNGFNMPFWGNAKDWGPKAISRGYAVTTTPAVGSVAWSQSGTWGHVAYVVAVSGGTVTIEEYNHNFKGTYDKRSVPASSFTGYIHFKDPTPDVVSPPQPPATSVPAAPTPTTPPTTPPTSPTPTPAPPRTFAETTGGVAHTWTNYTNAGGSQGPSIPANATVQIACRLSGFRVADGNTWWYRIAAGPWNGAFYVSADAFYNNGQTSGSLIGTPFVDPAVPDCG
jgi:surface antigen